MCVLSCFSHVQLFVTLWTVACETFLSIGFFRQEHWSGLLCPPPGDLPNPRTEPLSLMSPALTRRLFTTSATWEAKIKTRLYKFWLEEKMYRIETLSLKLAKPMVYALTSWVSWGKELSKDFTGFGWALAVAGASLRGKGNDSCDLLNTYPFDRHLTLDKQDKQDPCSLGSVF